MVEMLTVLAITTLLGAAGISFGVSTLSRSLCAVEFDTVRAALFQARHQALMSSTPVVAHLDADHFLITPSDVAFLPFTDIAGVPKSETVISITGPACDTSITINNVGAIIW